MNLLALFPGQGSQKIGMGRDLHAEHPLARELFSVADETLGFGLSKICFEGPEDRLTSTEIVQPAILTVSTICFQIARELFGDSMKIAAGAGHSLGEYSALVAAGALDFAAAVRIVHHRGKYMQEAVPRGEGKMLAVMGKEKEDLQEVLDTIDGVVEIANFNAPGQIVISGSAEAVNAAKEKLSGAKVVELVVSAPFHCALMQPAADRLAVDLNAAELHPCEFPVYANVTGRAVHTPEEVREALKQQVCGQVAWVECMQNAITERTPSVAVEFGTGSVLTGLLRRIEKDLPRATAGSMADIRAAVEITRLRS